MSKRSLWRIIVDNINIVKKIDAFGQPIQLNFDGTTSHKTVIGGFITLFIFTIMLMILITSFIRLTNNSSFIVEPGLEYQITPPPLIFQQKDFTFAISVQDTNVYLNNSIFGYSASLTTLIKVNNSNQFIKTKVPISLRPCDISDFQDFEDQYYKFFLSQAICPDYTNFIAQGAYGDDIFSYLKISVVQCVNNTTPNVTCAPQNYIDNYFIQQGKVRITLYFTNQLFNPYDYEIPFNTFLDNQVWVVSPPGTLVRNSDLYFRKSTVNSPTNVLGIGEGFNFTRACYSKDRTDDAYIPEPNDTDFLDIYMRSGNNIVTYFREYETLTQVLSFIGGIWNLLYLLLGFVAAFFNKLFFEANIANILYDFDATHCDYESEKKRKRKQAIEEEKFKESMNGHMEIKPSSQKKIFERFHKMKDMRATLNYNFKDLIMRLCHCFFKTFNTRYEMLEKATEKFGEDIDIRLILKRIQEVEKLKNLILNDDEKMIFDFVPPPIIAPKTIPLISYNQNEMDQFQVHVTSSKLINASSLNDSSMKLKVTKQTKMKNIFEDVFQELENYGLNYDKYHKMKQSNSIISKKIVNSLNPEIKDIFDAIDESQREKIYSIHNDNNNDNDKFFEIHNKDKTEEKTNIIDIEINDMSLLTRDVQIEMIKKEKNNMLEKQINNMSLSMNEGQIKNKQDLCTNEDQGNEKNSLNIENKKRGLSDSFIKITDKNMEGDKLSLR